MSSPLKDPQTVLKTVTEDGSLDIVADYIRDPDTINDFCDAVDLTLRERSGTMSRRMGRLWWTTHDLT